MVLKKLSLIKPALALNRLVTHVAEVKECPLLCNKCGSLGHHLDLWWRQNESLKRHLLFSYLPIKHRSTYAKRVFTR